MANSSSNTLIEDSIQVALDAADTATGVTEEFNTLKEQFEVQNIQAKRIYQSVSIIFVSSIAAAVICAAVGALIYFKTLSTLETNTNMAIESLAIFSENVGSLAKSVKTVEDNTANQELIKSTLVTLEAAAMKASEDVSGADVRYNSAIKLGIQETERVIQEFAKNTLADLEAQALASQTELSQQIAQIKAIFTPEVSEDTEGGEDVTPNDNIVKASQIEALELKLDEIILLQKEVTAKMLEQARKVEVQQAQAKKAPAKSKKPAANPLKFP
jgi:hypothetical protein